MPVSKLKLNIKDLKRLIKWGEGVFDCPECKWTEKDRNLFVKVTMKLHRAEERAKKKKI